MGTTQLDQATGTLLSRELTIQGDAMTLVVGGGMGVSELQVALRVDGQTVRTATGCKTEIMGRRTWDVRPFKGKRAQLRVLDESTGGWGHVLVDELVEWRKR